MFDTLYYRLCVMQVTKDVLTTVITRRNNDSSIDESLGLRSP